MTLLIFSSRSLLLVYKSISKKVKIIANPQMLLFELKAGRSKEIVAWGSVWFWYMSR